LYHQCIKNVALPSASFNASYSLSQQLQQISTLRQLCNHPELMYRQFRPESDVADENENGMSVVGTKPPRPTSNRSSRPLSSSADAIHDFDFSKIQRLAHSRQLELELLQAMIRYVHDHILDKVVIASNFTKALDGVQAMCGAQGFKWLRLDWSTQCDKRQKLVDQFNHAVGRFKRLMLASTPYTRPQRRWYSFCRARQAGPA
jgi:SNF2 family DNA or RNA helicase